MSSSRVVHTTAALLSLGLAVVLAGCSTSTTGSVQAPSRAAPAASLAPTSSTAKASVPGAPSLTITAGDGTEAAPVTADVITPRTPIVVKAVGAVVISVTVSNTRTKVSVPGIVSADQTSWRTTTPLGFGSTYEITATAQVLGGQRLTTDATARTVQPGQQSTVTITPGAGQGEVGVGQSVVFRFDRAVTDRAAVTQAIKVTSTPSQGGAWYWLSDSEVHYRTETYWQPGTVVAVQAPLYGVDLGDGVYGKADAATTFRVHDAWAAKVDGASNTMQIFRNNQPVKSLPFVLGAGVLPMHTGVHIISDKQPSLTVDSCGYGLCKGQVGYYKETVSLALRISADGEFVRSAAGAGREEAAAGGVRPGIQLSPADAQWFFDNFGMGDVVEVVNTGGTSLPVLDVYGDWQVPWSRWLTGGAR